MRIPLVLLASTVAVLGLISAPAAVATPSRPTVTSGDLTWQAPQRVDPLRGLTSVSCVSKSLCRAGDASDRVVRWNGHQWQPGYQFPSDAAGIDDVTCTSTNFCAAVEIVNTADGEGSRPVTRNADGTWDTSAAITPFTRHNLEIDPAFVSGAMSCTGPTFCMLVDQQQGYQTWNGTSWTAPATFQKENNTTYVSCAAATSCTAVGDVDLKNSGSAGKTVYTWDGSSWSAPHVVKVGNHVGGVSCPTTSFCMVTIGPRYVTVNGSHVSAARSMPNGLVSGGLTCTGATFCLGTNGGTKGSIRWNGTSWSGPHEFDGLSYLIPSCASPSFCVAVSDKADRSVAADRVDGTWQAPRTVESGTMAYRHLFPDDVSCSSPQSCVLVDGESSSLAYDGTSWSGPHRNATKAYRSVVSCVSAAFCAAGTENGRVQFRRNGHWAAPQSAVVNSGVGIESISCSSSTSCALLTYLGTFRVWNGKDWHTASTVNAEGFETALSCVQGGCVFLSTGGSGHSGQAHAWIYRTGAKKITKVGGWIPDSPSLSCASLTFCMTSGAAKGPTNSISSARELTGTTWQVAPTASGEVDGADVSCTSTTFCVLVGGRAESTWNGTQWSAEQQIVDEPLGRLDSLASVSCRPTICAAVTDDGWTVIAQ